jgi:hypothetical protein
MERLADVLVTNSKLQRLSITIANTEELQLLRHIVANPSCLLEELTITFGVTLFLEHCNTLKSVRCKFDFQNLPEENDDASFGSLLFILWNMLCDTSSIKATYNSNHSLLFVAVSNLSGITEIEISIEIYSLLKLNQVENNHEVARTKRMKIL